MGGILRSSRTALALALTVVLVALATTVVTAFGPSVSVATAEVDRPRLLLPDPSADLGVRTLPLRTPGGAFEQAFPDGVRLQDADALSVAVAEAADRVGFGDTIFYLLGRDLYPNIGQYAYPFEYGEIDDWVDTVLDEETLARFSGDVLDLGSMVAILGGMEWTNPEYPDTANLGGPVAYSILRRAMELEPSCDLATSLAWVVSLGQNPQVDAMRMETDRAAELCGPDDPTPLWLFAAGIARTIYFAPDYSSASSLLPSETLEVVEEAFGRLRAEFPDVPVGWAGLADVYLTQADMVEDVSGAPFQVREWRRKARDLYEEARAKSASPDLIVGHAHALSGLGLHDEAFQVLASAPDLTDLRVRLATSEALIAARRWADAAEDAAESAVVVPHWVEVRHGQTLSVSDEVVPHGVVTDYTLNEGGGSDIEDRGYLPRARRGLSLPPLCRGQVELLALLLDGRPEDTLARIDDGLSFDRIDDVNRCEDLFGSDSITHRIEAMAATLTKDLERRDNAAGLAFFGEPEDNVATTYAALQNLLRAHGQLEEANEVTRQWAAEQPENPRARSLAGEVHFLLGDDEAAISDFESALRLLDRSGEEWVVTSFDEASGESAHRVLRVQLAATLERRGEVGRAKRVLQSVVDESVGEEADYWAHSARLYALSDLGRIQVRAEDWAAAADSLRLALSSEVSLDNRFSTIGDARSELIYGGLLRGAQHNNLALALSNLGQDDEAVEAARAARERDPASPILRDTLGYALQGAGDTEAAVRLYRSALASDPTSYVSATNLAVLLAADDPGSEEARRLLDRATRTKPDYALAWHNLGVVQSQTWSPLDYLRGQRSLAKARRLDRDLRDADLALMADTTIYQSGLDVSAPLPPDWTYGASASERGNGLVWTLAILLLLRVAWALGLDRISGYVITAAQRHQGAAWWSRARPAAWAVGFSLAIVLWTGVRQLGWSAGLLISAIAVAAVAAVPLALRRMVGVGPAGHYTWPPGVVAGSALSMVGVMFVPYPTLREGSPVAARARWIGPIGLAVIATTFMAVAFVTAVPLASLLAAVAVAVLASMLTPVPPFDGAELKGRVLNTAATLSLAGATVLAALNLV